MTVTKRGRPSAADLTTVTMTPVGVVSRVRPPHNLTDEAVEVWVSITESMPADHFSAATVPMLTSLCRHVVEGNRVAELIERSIGKEFSVSEYKMLLQMQRDESATVAMLSTKLRITQQSTLNWRGNKNQVETRKKLWD